MHLAKAGRRNEIRASGIECDIASWYSWLSGVDTIVQNASYLTFPSISLPLSVEEANAILRQHYLHFAKRKREYTPPTLQTDLTTLSRLHHSIQAIIDLSSIPSPVPSVPSHTPSPISSSISCSNPSPTNISDHSAALISPSPLPVPSSSSSSLSPSSLSSPLSPGMFIRLFSRSPKDGISVYGGTRAISIYFSLLSLTSHNYSETSLFWSSTFNLSPSSLLSHPPPPSQQKGRDKEKAKGIKMEDAILKYNALALTDWCLLRVFDANEALQLLYSSERVRFDLTLDLERTEKMGEKWDNGIMLRKWDDRIRPDLEFRCFVHKQRITAVSQYDPIGFFPHVVNSRDAIKGKIFSFYEEVIRSRVPLEDYIIDLAIIPARHEMDVVVIELNPFDEWTSGALFDWQVDAEVLLGNAPFEFRLHTELHHKFVEIVGKLEDKFMADNKKIAKDHKNLRESRQERDKADFSAESDFGESFLQSLPDG